MQDWFWYSSAISVHQNNLAAVLSVSSRWQHSICNAGSHTCSTNQLYRLCVITCLKNINTCVVQTLLSYQPTFRINSDKHVYKCNKQVSEDPTSRGQPQKYVRPLPDSVCLLLQISCGGWTAGVAVPPCLDLHAPSVRTTPGSWVPPSRSPTPSTIKATMPSSSKFPPSRRQSSRYATKKLRTVC